MLTPNFDVVRIVSRARGEEAALAAMKEYVDAEPDNTDLKFAYGDFLIQQKKNDDAHEIYIALEKSNDQDVATRARNQIASVRLLEGDKDGAAELIDEILKKDEGNPTALVKRAGLRIDSGQYDDAILDLRTALNNDPETKGASLLMAAAFERKGDLALAESQLAEAVEAANNEARTSNTFARFLMRQRKMDRAERVLVDSLAANPGDINNLKFLAAIRIAKQDWQGAEEVAEIIDRIDDSSAATNIKSIALAGLEDYDGVIDTLSQANEKAPLESRPLATLVAAYLKTDRADEAEALLRRMIENNDEHYNEQILLVQVLSSTQRNEERQNRFCWTRSKNGRTGRKPLKSFTAITPAMAGVMRQR